MGEEALHGGVIAIEQPAVEMARIPLDQHAADVEDHGRHRIIEQSWSRRRFSNVQAGLVQSVNELLDRFLGKVETAEHVDGGIRVVRL